MTKPAGRSLNGMTLVLSPSSLFVPSNAFVNALFSPTHTGNATLQIFRLTLYALMMSCMTFLESWSRISTVVPGIRAVKFFIGAKNERKKHKLGHQPHFLLWSKFAKIPYK